MRPALKITVIVLSIVLVVGIFVPFVVRIRGAAERLQCSNNLKLIAIAVLNYHDTYGKFPPGTRPSVEVPIDKRPSWMFEVLPFVESDPTYSMAAKDQSWDAPANRILLENWRCYMCPSGPTLHSAYSSGLTHYVGIAGLGEDAATFPLGDSRIGIFGYDRQVSREDVKDGISNTLMVMETRRDNGPWAAGGPSTIRGLDPDDAPYFGSGRQFGGMHLGSQSFFQRRSPVTNCACADGTVRAISSSIDPQIFQAILTIAAEDGPYWMHEVP
jgi:hypothetical protein